MRHFIELTFTQHGDPVMIAVEEIITFSPLSPEIYKDLPETSRTSVNIAGGTFHVRETYAEVKSKMLALVH